MTAFGPEGRFRTSRKNEDCPKDANWWHSYSKSGAEIEVGKFLYGLVRMLQPDLVVETGTAWGETAYNLGLALGHNGHGKLVTLEPLQKRVAYASKLVAGLPVRCVCSPALNWSPENGEVIDFLFIDSIFKSRMKELDHFKKHMNQYSFVAWHDTGTQHNTKDYAIVKMINKLATRNELQPIFFPTPRGLCLARMTK